MENTGQKTDSPSCGPDCACNTKKGLSTRTRMILIAIIIITAGAVLSNSLIKKSRSCCPVPQASGYSSVLHPATVPADSTRNPLERRAAETKPPIKSVSIAPLASFGSLDTDAKDVDGVFILLVNDEKQKTPEMVQEIAAAANAIASRGVRMSIFQLASASQDFTAITAQLPTPGVLAVIKGKGMRGVQGKDITQAKLLQAALSAMQPGSCCPAGGKRVCK
jgi:hypothetical protein